MTAQSLSRLCCRCKVRKGADGFYHKRGLPVGWCRQCMSVYYKQRYVETDGLVAAIRREKIMSTPELLAKERERCRLKQRKRWAEGHRPKARRKRAINPAKRSARGLLWTALKRGEIAKPTSCSDCGGQFPSKRIHAHHVNYDEPLNVQWLCSVCHGVRHRK